LRGILGDYPFSRVSVANGVLSTKLVQQVFAAKAKACLERAGAVIEARMDDLIV